MGNNYLPELYLQWLPYDIPVQWDSLVELENFFFFLWNIQMWWYHKILEIQIQFLPSCLSYKNFQNIQEKLETERKQSPSNASDYFGDLVDFDSG